MSGKRDKHWRYYHTMKIRGRTRTQYGRKIHALAKRWGGGRILCATNHSRQSLHESGRVADNEPITCKTCKKIMGIILREKLENGR